MSPTQWFQQNIGKAILVPGGGAGNNGQCFQAFDSYLHDVYNKPYIYTPRAINVWTYALLDQFGFVKVDAGLPVLAGDFIFYDARVGNIAGHVGIASQDGYWNDFYSYDSNWGGTKFWNAQGYPTLHEVRHNDSYNKYIVGYYRRAGGRGAESPAPTINKETVPMMDDNFTTAFFIDLFNVRPSESQLAAFRGRPWMEVYNELRSSKARADYLAWLNQVVVDNDARAKLLSQAGSIDLTTLKPEEASLLVKVAAWFTSIGSK